MPNLLYAYAILLPAAVLRCVCVPVPVQLVELGVVDNLLKYHVTAGKAALTSDRLKDGMKLTMLNEEKTTILKK
jgi:hypothetical protein